LHNDSSSQRLLILLISANNEHFVNVVTMVMVSHVDKIQMQMPSEQGFRAKAVIHAHPCRTLVHTYVTFKAQLLMVCCKET